MSPLRLATLSLSRRKVPTLITAIAIAISVTCSGILLRLYRISSSRFDSLGQGWESVVGAKAGGIEILLNSLNGEGAYPDFLPSALYESLRASQTVHFEDGQNADPKYIRQISPFLYFGKWNTSRVAGTDEQFIRGLSSNGEPLSAGRIFNGAAAGAGGAGTSPGTREVSGTGEVVLGSEVAARERAHLDDEITFGPWFGDALDLGASAARAVRAKVVGLLKPTHSAFDRVVFASIGAAQSVVADQRVAIGERSIWGSHVLNYFFINLNPGGLPKLQALINKRTVGQVIVVGDERRKLEDLTGAGRSIGLFVSFFVILLSGLSVSAMLITRFEAMTVQLAVLRAIGYRRREIGLWLLWEGLLLGLVGCAVGIALDLLIFPPLRELLGSAVPPPEVTPSPILTSWPIWALAMLATVGAILIPMIRLYRQDVHQALKG